MIPVVLLTISVSGCANLLISEDAICTSTLELRKAHAGALLADGGPLSQETGERLLSGVKAGCNE